MGDEIKRIAVVKDVNLTKVRAEIAKQEENYNRDKSDFDERMLVASKLTKEEVERVFGDEKRRLEQSEKSLGKAKVYLKDVEEATPVIDMEKGKAVKGEPRRPLKDAI